MGWGDEIQKAKGVISSGFLERKNRLKMLIDLLAFILCIKHQLRTTDKIQLLSLFTVMRRSNARCEVCPTNY